ncbi:MAG: winged helix-turn-helix domain-containing protein [archaeon]
MRQKSGHDTKTLLARWDIISSLAEQPRAATDIAKDVQKSLPYITQQLKLLEAMNVIKVDRIDNSGSPGKPKTIYILLNELLLLATPTRQKILKVNPISMLLANVMLLDSQDDMICLLKTVCKEDFFSKVKGLSIIKSKETLELFVLTEHVEDLRKKYSNFDIHLADKIRKVVCWTHNTFEVEEGLNKKESYFVNLFQNPSIMYDPEKHIARLLKLRP